MFRIIVLLFMIALLLSGCVYIAETKGPEVNNVMRCDSLGNCDTMPVIVKQKSNFLPGFICGTVLGIFIGAM